MYAKLSRHGDRAAEEEEGVEDIKRKRNRCTGHDSGKCACYQENEGQHREDCDKHIIVDDGWVASDGISNDVADKRQDQESP